MLKSIEVIYHCFFFYQCLSYSCGLSSLSCTKYPFPYRLVKPSFWLYGYLICVNCVSECQQACVCLVHFIYISALRFTIKGISVYVSVCLCGSSLQTLTGRRQSESTMNPGTSPSVGLWEVACERSWRVEGVVNEWEERNREKKIKDFVKICRKTGALRGFLSFTFCQTCPIHPTRLLSGNHWSYRQTCCSPLYLWTLLAF